MLLRRELDAWMVGMIETMVAPIEAKDTYTHGHSEMVARLARQEGRAKRSDTDLLARARELSRRFLAAKAQPASVRWVDNQRSRWGSCTPADRSIRLSRRLESMPPFVVDYVLLHELAHLLVPGHGPEFWAQLAPYPQLDRARGYLEGVAATAGLRLSDDDDAVDTVDAVDTTDAVEATGPPRPGARHPVAATDERLTLEF